MVLNRYSIFVRDIEPKGFRLPVINGLPTWTAVNEVRRLLEDAEYRQEVVDHNYNVARRYFSYSVVSRKLRAIVANIRGS